MPTWLFTLQPGARALRSRVESMHPENTGCLRRQTVNGGAVHFPRQESHSDEHSGIPRHPASPLTPSSRLPTSTGSVYCVSRLAVPASDVGRRQSHLVSLLLDILHHLLLPTIAKCRVERHYDPVLVESLLGLPLFGTTTNCVRFQRSLRGGRQRKADHVRIRVSSRQKLSPHTPVNTGY